ncbi:MAG TPA: hypothetical protein VF530_09455 [Planctomycetota bacterium]
MRSSLLVLGGGPFALPLLTWAREAGLEATLVDPETRAAARRAAHAFERIPADDAPAHAALARRLHARALERGGRLAGVVATEERALALLPAVSEAVPGCLARRSVLEHLATPERARARLRERGFAVTEAAAETLAVHAFFRDGGFVPCGLARRTTLAGGDLLCLAPGELTPAAARMALVTVERAARALGLEQGLLEARLVPEESGFALAGLAPTFTDLLGAAQVARLAYGKSPLQAWLAHLAGVGGPFDEPSTTPRGAAGWLAVAAPPRGVFAGIDHVTRARALGLADLWVDEPGRTLGPTGERARPLAYLWAAADDLGTVETRLRAARATLSVRVAEVQRVA